MFNAISNIPYRDIHGVLESIQPLEEIEIDTRIGALTPIYEVEDHGRLKLTPVKLHKSGELKSIQLQKRKNIETSAGIIGAELLTFYESGNLCRLFPLNGKLSGYWTQKNEYDLAESIFINTPIGEIFVKPISLYFYETGELKSITFWPGEVVDINTPIGRVPVRTGISFYKNGKIHSIEPFTPLEITTSIGEIEVYDPEPVGISGDKNSLVFNEDGDIISLSTIGSEVSVANSNGINIIYTPEIKPGRCSDNEEILLPLKITFNDDSVKFKHGFREIGFAESTTICTTRKFEFRFDYEYACSKST